jgi:transketolase
MIGMAAGLALCGKIPFATSFSSFITNRCLDQIRMSIAYSNANVKIVGSHGGLLTGADGPSAQEIGDLGQMRGMPRMTVLNPADFFETKAAVHAIAAHQGPCYLRTTREAVPVFFDETIEFQIGKGTIIADGKDACIINSGALLSQALRAKEELKKQGINSMIINMPCIKPLDAGLVTKASKQTNFLVTVEDHSIYNGLGSAVAEILCEEKPCRMHRIGVQDTFAESGKPLELLAKYGLDSTAIVAAVKKGLAK